MPILIRSSGQFHFWIDITAIAFDPTEQRVLNIAIIMSAWWTISCGRVQTKEQGAGGEGDCGCSEHF
jgi:hypothetical protein